MKNRVVKKVEKRMLVDKVCELQREICEHERFLGDLMLMLITENPDHKALEVSFTEMDTFESSEIWKRVQKLIRDNKGLARKLETYE